MILIDDFRVGEEGQWDVQNGRATRSNLTHFTVDNLAPFTIYSFRVVAVNGIGQSHPSKESYYMVTLREGNSKTFKSHTSIIIPCFQSTFGEQIYIKNSRSHLWERIL